MEVIMLSMVRKCPHCGAEVSFSPKLPKRVRLHDHKNLTDKFQVIMQTTEINPSDVTRTNKYNDSRKVSRVVVYHVMEDL